MVQMYARLTVNLSHLASRLILALFDQGVTEIEADRLHGLLYLALKKIQNEPSIHLHRSLIDPDDYRGVHDGSNRLWTQFRDAAVASSLIAVSDRRLPVPAGAAAQERRPRSASRERHSGLCQRAGAIAARLPDRRPDCPPGDRTGSGRSGARLLFDDEMRSYSVAREAFSRPRHLAINGQETASESGEPYLLVPGDARKLGVVLVHGFLASPAELRPFGERLAAQRSSGDRRASERSRNLAVGFARALLAGLARLGEARLRDHARSCRPGLPRRLLHRRLAGPASRRRRARPACRRCGRFAAPPVQQSQPCLRAGHSWHQQARRMGFRRGRRHAVPDQSIRTPAYQLSPRSHPRPVRTAAGRRRIVPPAAGCRCPARIVHATDDPIVDPCERQTNSRPARLRREDARTDLLRPARHPARRHRRHSDAHSVLSRRMVHAAARRHARVKKCHSACATEDANAPVPPHVPSGKNERVDDRRRAGEARLRTVLSQLRRVRPQQKSRLERPYPWEKSYPPACAGTWRSSRGRFRPCSTRRSENLPIGRA